MNNYKLPQNQSISSGHIRPCRRCDGFSGTLCCPTCINRDVGFNLTYITIFSPVVMMLALTFPDFLSLRQYTHIRSITLGRGALAPNKIFEVVTTTIDTVNNDSDSMKGADTNQLPKNFAGLKKLHLDGANYNYVELFKKIGTISTLEELIVDLATPTSPDICPEGQASALASWYSENIVSAIHGLVGERSELERLTLRGFNAYDVTYDLLGQLLDPQYLPRLSYVNLSGFHPSVRSVFWSRIQLDHGNDDTVYYRGKLPIDTLIITLKHCRSPDIVHSSVYKTHIHGTKALLNLFGRGDTPPSWIRPRLALTRRLHCHLYVDGEWYFAAGFNGSNDRILGQSFVVNDPIIGNGHPMFIDHVPGEDIVWDGHEPRWPTHYSLGWQAL